MKLYSALLITLTLLLSSCAFKSISRYKNITYMNYDAALKIDEQKLNVFKPRSPKTPKDVLIFLHGGGWTSGNKSLYNFLGSRMARKGVVVVIIDYPLSPKANYYHMAKASTKAVDWVKNNIEKYGGNPDKIFISGHSAGGQLAALVTVRDAYFDTLGVTSPIKGAILIDAGGLDMYGYLSEEKFDEGHSYFKTFTKNPLEWKKASALYHLHDDMPPMLIYRGERTYPSIVKSNEKFITALRKFAPMTTYKIQKRKKHVPMITQFFMPWNPRYDEIIEFMKTTGRNN